MSYKAFVCKTDWVHHFPDDYDGVTVYFSEKSLRDHRDCVEQCGVKEVVVMSKEDHEKFISERDELQSQIDEINMYIPKVGEKASGALKKIAILTDALEYYANEADFFDGYPDDTSNVDINSGVSVEVDGKRARAALQEVSNDQ